MKKRILTSGLLCLIGLLFGTTFAVAETGHYVNGVEGIKAGSVPPPGFYYRMYNVFYKADKLMDQNGDEIKIGFDVNVFAVANRFLWVSDKKILGANYAIDAVVPLVYTDIEIKQAGIDQSKFGVGDIFVEPLVLSWHGPQYDASFGMGMYMPTGKYDKTDLSSPGKDFWTLMWTLGGTWYFDTEKTWSASVLSRYETHSDKRDTDVKPGDNFHFEWGVGKTLSKVWDVGISGYCNWQVTDDKGDDVVWDKSVHDRSFAAGPEISLLFPPPTGLMLSLRNLWEFETRDGSEGTVTTLTLTKFF